jgi:hypothetical protein
MKTLNFNSSGMHIVGKVHMLNKEHGMIDYNQLRADLRETSDLIKKLNDILTRTANDLKSKPKPLSAHLWHDLRKIAAFIRARGKE